MPREKYSNIGNMEETSKYNTVSTFKIEIIQSESTMNRLSLISIRTLVLRMLKIKFYCIHKIHYFTITVRCWDNTSNIDSLRIWIYCDISRAQFYGRKWIYYWQKIIAHSFNSDDAGNHYKGTWALKCIWLWRLIWFSNYP